MSMNKIVNIPLETTAYYQSLSKLNVQLWNQDKNTAELRFLITRNNFPLPLSTENVKVILALESGDSFISTDDLDIENEVEGVATYIIPEEFMKVATSVVGQIYVTTIDGDEIVVQRKFSFEVAEDLLSTIPSEEKIRYIKMFDDLKEEMTIRLDGITSALSQLESNIDAVNNARETGITAINNLYNAKLVTFNQNFDDKMALVNGAIEDLEEYATVTLSDMTTKKEEFDASVTGSGLVTTGQTVNWQKHKLTPDNGRLNSYLDVNFNAPEESFGSETLFGYVANSTNYPSGVSGTGYFKYFVRTTDYMKLEFMPFNSDRVFQKRKQAGTWNGWVEIITSTDATSIETTTGSQNKANTAENNAKTYTDEKYSKRNSVLFEGNANGVGTPINLNETLDNFIVLYIFGDFPGGEFAGLGNPQGTRNINLNFDNIVGLDATGTSTYECSLTKVSRQQLQINSDNSMNVITGTSSGANANKFTIQKIVGVYK